MICSSCGIENDNASKVCKNCKQELNINENNRVSKTPDDAVPVNEFDELNEVNEFDEVNVDNEIGEGNAVNRFDENKLVEEASPVNEVTKSNDNVA